MVGTSNQSVPKMAIDFALRLFALDFSSFNPTWVDDPK